jgi:hypothetical protein
MAQAAGAETETPQRTYLPAAPYAALASDILRGVLLAILVPFLLGEILCELYPVCAVVMLRLLASAVS